ncbi:MAG: hypothetical protein JSV97_11240 [candidate division WOR-3 bacterium]|nr:MAG: hypothetical protein JSV97_11240 [candidate division WOR-3 bacterium]
MPKLTPEDWRKLREKRVAFTGLSERIFELLLAKIYEGAKDPDQVDDTDALMVYLAHAEPPIPPTG